MPSNSSDFNQISNIAPSGHVQTIHNVIKDTGPSQELQNHHQLQQELQKCHKSYSGVFYAFKLNRFQLNFKHTSLRAYAHHTKRHQRHQPQSVKSNHHQLQQELQKCHHSQRDLLMPSNSTDLNLIFYITSSALLKISLRFVWDKVRFDLSLNLI